MGLQSTLNKVIPVVTLLFSLLASAHEPPSRVPQVIYGYLTCSIRLSDILHHIATCSQNSLEPGRALRFRA